jgi:hypothetical protein
VDALGEPGACWALDGAVVAGALGAAEEGAAAGFDAADGDAPEAGAATALDGGSALGGFGGVCIPLRRVASPQARGLLFSLA